MTRPVYYAKVPLDDALVLSNLCEYRHKSYIAKNYNISGGRTDRQVTVSNSAVQRFQLTVHF